MTWEIETTNICEEKGRESTWSCSTSKCDEKKEKIDVKDYTKPRQPSSRRNNRKTEPKNAQERYRTFSFPDSGIRVYQKHP